MAQPIIVGTLPNGEGTLIAISRVETLREQFLKKHTLRTFIFVHEGDNPDGNLTGDTGGCGGTFELVRISSTKSVLACSRCHLRKSIPNWVANLNDLIEHLDTLES